VEAEEKQLDVEGKKEEPEKTVKLSRRFVVTGTDD
jgi:hypothetical protein